MSAYAFLGKGQDFCGWVLEWGGATTHVLSLVAHLRATAGARWLLAPQGAEPLAARFAAAGASVCGQPERAVVCDPARPAGRAHGAGRRRGERTQLGSARWTCNAVRCRAPCGWPCGVSIRSERWGAGGVRGVAHPGGHRQERRGVARGLLEHHRQLYDEAVVVDTGSHDGSPARAIARGARVFCACPGAMTSPPRATWPWRRRGGAGSSAWTLTSGSRPRTRRGCA